MRLILLSGTLAGLLHVLSGPDHLTAIAPIAVCDGRRAWFAGWTWGIGHATGVVCVAVTAILLRGWMPPVDALSQWGERAVGVALIAVGVWSLRRSGVIGGHPHVHGSIAHGHLHIALGPAWFQRLGHAHASFYLGILHGVAGSSHFFGVLPALALPSAAASLTYIAAFGLGTIAAMTGFAAAAGILGSRLRNHTPRRALMLVSSIAALIVGAVWLMD